MVENTPFHNNKIVNVNDFSKKLTDKMKKSVVRFEHFYFNEGKGKTGTGFICKINYENDKYIYALITCYHIIDDKYREHFESLAFSYFKEKENNYGFIDLKKKRIFYQNKDLDITIIEIKEEDKLDLFSFLEIDYSINTGPTIT